MNERSSRSSRPAMPLSLPEVEAVVHTPPELASNAPGPGSCEAGRERWNGADLFEPPRSTAPTPMERLQRSAPTGRQGRWRPRAARRSAIGGSGRARRWFVEAIDALEWAASHYQAVGDRESERRALCDLVSCWSTPDCLASAAAYGRCIRAGACGSLETLRRRAHVLRATTNWASDPTAGSLRPQPSTASCRW